jgi:hypothetical protein
MIREFDLDLILELLPVPGISITCGERKHLFKKLRRHTYVSLGTDTHNKGVEGICEVTVFACLICGKDKRE